MKILDYRMCDVDGCSSTDNLTRYKGDHDLCKYHKYLAKRAGYKPAEKVEDEEELKPD